MGVIALLLVVAGFLFWRLVEKPISLDFLTPLLVEAFDTRTSGDGTTEITGTRLLWDDKRQSLELQVTGLRIDDATGQQSFSLPLADIDFSFGQLLEGKVEVTDLNLVGARLTVRRNPDRGFEVLLLQDTTAGDEQPAPRQILAQPGKPGSAAGATGIAGAEGEQALSAINALLTEQNLGPINRLRSVSLINSEIVVDDQVLGFTWTLPAEKILLLRSPEGLSGEIDLGLPLGGQLASADLAFVYDKAKGALDIAGQVGNLDLSRLTTLLPQVQGLAVLESDLNGDISATLAEDGSLFFVDFELTAGPGQLRPATDRTSPIEITGGAINGRIDLAESRLTIDDARLDTGSKDDAGPTISAALSLTRTAADSEARRWRLAVNAAASPFSIEKLAWLWPAVFGTNAHAWVVENITKGEVRNLRAQLSFDLGSGGATNQEISGAFGFDDLTLYYLRPMPPMLGLGGVAKVEGDRLIFDIIGGRSEGLDLGAGKVTLYDLAGDLPKILIEMPVSGTLTDMLAVLDHPRLRLISRTGIDQRGIAGQGRVEVTMGFPLLADLEGNQIDLTTKGAFTDVFMPRLVLGQDVRARDITVDADTQRVIIAGDASIAGSSFYARYRQDYSGAMDLTGESRRIEASTLAVFAPLLGDRIGNHLAGKFHIQGNPARRLTIAVDADLTAATLMQPAFDWKKPSGAAADLTGTLVLEGGELRTVENLRLDAPDMRMAGSMVFDDRAEFQEARISYVQHAQFDLTDVEIGKTATAVNIRIGGGTVDARDWISKAELPTQDPGERLEEAKAPDRANVILDGVDLLLPAGKLSQVRGKVDDVAGNPSLDLTGSLQVAGQNDGEVAIVYAPSTDEGWRAGLELANLGALLRALDLYGDLQGGQVSWQARTPPGQPKGPLTGTLIANSLHLDKVPSAVSRLASSKQGLTIDTLKANLTVEGDRISTPDLRAVGSDLGLTAKGTADIDADSVDITGKVVPAYDFNSFLDSIPILGWIVTGGKDQGLFAINYKVSGSLRDPRVVVNPLSAVTPPILRSLAELLAEGARAGGGKPSTSMAEPPGPMR
ncbi:MAG: AsmA-like C-terminal domain-containing protein [Rhodospirillales bacterium]